MGKTIEVDLDKFLQFTLLNHLNKSDTEYYLQVLSDDEKEKLARLHLDKSIEEAEKLLASFQLYIDSLDTSDPNVTNRVLTIMRGDEY